MNHHQLTRAAELAPDCPIIALALLLRIAEQPRGAATIDSLSGPLSADSVWRALNIAGSRSLVTIATDTSVYLTITGERLAEAASGGCGEKRSLALAEWISVEGHQAMSNRSLVELNHDHCPMDDDASLIKWARAMRYYMGSGRKDDLPYGVTFKAIRHHSESDPMDGWGDPS